MPANPPPVITCLPRSLASTDTILESLHIETNERYKREFFQGAGWRTKCNKLAEDYADAMGVHLPKGLLAREQIPWLGGPDGRRQGWSQLKEDEANQWADKGCPVFVTWLNPIPAESSHIAVLRASKVIAQAGGKNFSHGSIHEGFGMRVVQFYGHL